MAPSVWLALVVRPFACTAFSADLLATGCPFCSPVTPVLVVWRLRQGKAGRHFLSKHGNFMAWPPGTTEEKKHKNAGNRQRFTLS
jgi:hypothetical protein